MNEKGRMPQRACGTHSVREQSVFWSVRSALCCMRISLMTRREDEMREETMLICGEEYSFDCQIREKKDVVRSFNELANHTFGLWFEELGQDYIPHVIRQGSRVVSNISVNVIHFQTEAGRKLYIQLGTVMTVPDKRKKGLSRILMERILEEWKGRCDGIYLFANDSVLEFYPKFGFIPQTESEYIYHTNGIVHGLPLIAFDTDQQEVVNLIQRKYKEGNPYSRLCMVDNEAIYRFYYEGLMKNHLYYIPEYDVLVAVEKEEEAVYCYEILGTSQVPLQEILNVVASHWNAEQIVLGFSPNQTEGLECRIHKEEDCTLFVHRELGLRIDGKKLMFPMLSHA